MMSAILSAFPDAPPPAFDASSPRPEIAFAALQIENFTWRTAPAHVLDAVHAALAWLDSASFVYWLPGLLVDLMVARYRFDSSGVALMAALTPVRASDLQRDLRTLDALRDGGSFDEEDHQAAVEQLTTWHQYGRTQMFEDRVNRLTQTQYTVVLEVIEYLAREYAWPDAAEAVARWRAG